MKFRKNAEIVVQISRTRIHNPVCERMGREAKRLISSW